MPVQVIGHLVSPVSPNEAAGLTEWDAYAPFYDWENVRTFGGRDLAFWGEVASREAGRLLELGCGTGRLLAPLARHRGEVAGIDRSPAMLEAARQRCVRLSRRRRPTLILGDIRRLPFADASHGVVLAPYGILQSLLAGRDLDRALCEAARVLRSRGLLGIDLVPDLPAWAEYGPRVQLEGRRRGGGRITLVEAVRQDRRRGMTIFDEEFIERRAGRTRRHRFTLTFRTRPMPQMLERIERAGFRVEARFGDYESGPWSPDSGAWLILARKSRVGGRRSARSVRPGSQ